MEASDLDTSAGTGARTIAELLPLAAELYADRVALTTKRDGRWTEVRYAEVGSIVCEFALGLLEVGIAQGDRVAILGNTRPEWTYVDLAVATAGAVAVPIYPSSSPGECEWVLGDSEAKVVVCESATQLSKITAIRERLPALATVILIDADADSEPSGVLSLEEVRQRGRAADPQSVRERTAAVSTSDPYRIIYTSGTTGRPKGCVLSHRNYRAILDSMIEVGMGRPDDVIYLFLPLAHTAGLVLQLLSFEVGSTLAYFSGDQSKVIDELGEVQPTYFPSVPRIFEKIYALVAPSIITEVGEEEFAEMVSLGVEVRDLEYAGRQVPDELRERWDLIDKRWFERVRGIFGGRIRQAATGAAPIDKQMHQFFYAAGIPMVEGYGMTETASGITTGTPQHLKFGTVGRALPGVEVRVADDGEILVKGDNVFEGYYRNPEATTEVLIDGWLHTGDLGTIDDKGYLQITGRKKDIIVTAGGKNITPANVENDLKKSRYVSQAVMHGDRRPFPTMLITLDQGEIAEWAAQRGKTQDLAALAEDADVIAMIGDEVNRVNANYAQVAQVKKFFILDHDLSQESGELTPTMKVKRNVVNERYAERFDALYQTNG